MKKKFKMGVQYNEDLSFHEECKQLSIYIYHQQDNNAALPNGYKVLGVAINTNNGFYAEVVRKGDDVVIVTRGTEPIHSNDYKNDLAMVLGNAPAQYYSLMELYNKEIIPMKEKEPNIKVTFTGHSLGATESHLAALTTGEDAVTFSAYGARNLLPENITPQNAKIINYGNEDDGIFMQRFKQQVGEIRIVGRINDEYPHKIENWGSLEDYVPHVINPNAEIKEEKKRIKYERCEYIMRRDEEEIRSYVGDISKCPGRYPVSGYKRSDGKEVSGYIRNCYKHGG